LFSLISTLEKSTLETLKNEELNMDTLMTIMSTIEQGDSIGRYSVVGCIDHKEEMSKAIVRFFLIMRICFIVKRANYKDSRLVKKKQKKKQESIQTIKNNNYVNVTSYPFIYTFIT